MILLYCRYRSVITLMQHLAFDGHLHIDKNYVGSDLRPDELDHTSEVGHKAIRHHEVGDDIGIQ